MEVASILSLNDDCLCKIVSYIRDPTSFYSLTRTCKRLRHLTSNSKNCHIEILRSRAEYFIKRLVVHLGAKYEKRKRGSDYNAYDEFCKLKKFIAEAVQYSNTRSLLTYDKVVDVWRTSGPVASEVLKWIRNHSSSISEGHPRATCITTYSSFTVHLPKKNQEMTVNTDYFHDYIGNYDDKLNIEVKCGGVKVVEEEFYRMMPDDFKYWSDDQMKQLVESMKPVTDLLQEELGETVPSIDGHFLFWFLYFYPAKMSLEDEDKLMFKDAARNEKPTNQAIEAVMNIFQKNLLREFQAPSEKWLSNKPFPEETETCKAVNESLDILVQRCDAQFLGKVEGDMSRIFGVITDYDLRALPEKLMFALVKRTSFETDNFSSAATADKFVDNTVSFKLLGSNKVMKVEGGMEGDGQSYPTWYRLILDFDLPDNKKIHLDSGDIYGHRSTEQKMLDVSQLRPITKLLQECINDSMEGEEKIPEIRDMFTAVYFIRVLDFGDNNFLGESIELSDLIVEEDEDEDESSDE